MTKRAGHFKGLQLGAPSGSAKCGLVPIRNGDEYQRRSVNNVNLKSTRRRKCFTKGIADGTMHNAPIHLNALSHAHALVFESRLSHGIRDSASALLC